LFTGLIEELGTVESVKATHQGATIKIKASVISPYLNIGDSISTDGVCLTVAKKTKDGFLADVMPVTFSNTILGTLSPGSQVNLERAMTLSGRLDGHMVTGHVDLKGAVAQIRQEGNATVFRIRLPLDIVKKMIDRGSVAINGISLTIQKLHCDGIEVSIIPHTQINTTLSYLKIGDEVNIELDVIGKYVERLLGVDKLKSNVDKDLLTKCGFL
jgi:riboflavin synthase